MRTFGTHGPVHPDKNYVVRRSKEIADFINRVKADRYIVIFAPRQTGKTTFFQRALHTLSDEETTYFPKEAVKGFLHSLRRIYLPSSTVRCPHSVGIVGVKNIRQLNYDRSVPPFNIQYEFNLPNFTLEQVDELLGQYTTEVCQVFAQEFVGQPPLFAYLDQFIESVDGAMYEVDAFAHFRIYTTSSICPLKGRMD